MCNAYTIIYFALVLNPPTHNSSRYLEPFTIRILEMFYIWMELLFSEVDSEMWQNLSVDL